MIHLDTNFLILAGRIGTAQAAQYNAWLVAGERFAVSAMAWAEFQCGPATLVEARTAMKMVEEVVPIMPADATKGAELFNLAGRRRGSLADCLIAAVALRCGASPATENRADFAPFVSAGLQVVP